MSNRYTAAHWGAYQITGKGDNRALKGLKTDPVPSAIGYGWIDALKDTNMRIARPTIRKGWLTSRDRNRSGDAEFVEVPWDEALDLAAEALKTTIDTHGNSAIFAGSYGWASAGRVHHAQSNMRRFLNLIGGNTASLNTYSHAAAEVLLPHITGLGKYPLQDQMTTWPDIAEHCQLMVAFGGISPRTAQIESSGTTTHEVRPWLQRAAQNGMKTVNISPQRTDFETDAQWITPRPGTDTALMLALAHEFFRTGRADRTFLARCTHGADQLETYTADKTPAWAAAICDIPEAVITKLAQDMATNRTMISVAWGLQRAHHGEQTVWMGLALAAILGEIGKPGTGFGFGYGSTAPVGRPSKTYPWPSIPQGINPVKSFIPVARITDLLENPGGTFTYDGKTHTYPDTKLIYWAGGNPYHHHQDLARLETAWQKPDTVIVNDHTWTATARRADIVLPATAPLERHDLMLNRRDPGLVYMSPAMDPVGDARHDYDIFASLAERFGQRQAFTNGKTPEDWMAWIWQGCEAVAKSNGFDLPSFEAFKEMGYVECPDYETHNTLFKDFAADPDTYPLATPSGKLQLSHDILEGPRWTPPAEWLGEAAPDQLHLLSPQPPARLHAQLDNGSRSRASKLNGREPCYMHPDAASAKGINAGDLVLVENARGACLTAAVLTDAIRADCIAIATGSSYDPHVINGKRICVHGNPNILTLDMGASGLSQGNIAHTCLVTISKWIGPAPNIRALSLPKITRPS